MCVWGDVTRDGIVACRFQRARRPLGVGELTRGPWLLCQHPCLFAFVFAVCLPRLPPRPPCPSDICRRGGGSGLKVTYARSRSLRRLAARSRWRPRSLQARDSVIPNFIFTKKVFIYCLFDCVDRQNDFCKCASSRKYDSPVNSLVAIQTTQ